MTSVQGQHRVAVIGAGIAGASCARLLADAGVPVQVFDKSRGVGGRMATRRMAGAGGDGGSPHAAAFDHGAPAFMARTPEFTRFVEQAERAGWLARWPAVAPARGDVRANDGARWVAQPDMPTLCRQLLAGLPVDLSFTVDALHREAAGWRIASAGHAPAQWFSQVVLAVPAPQAAPLLRPHRADWSQQAATLRMSPCWTLMGLADLAEATPSWNLAEPGEGPLQAIVRNATKPGRDRPAGRAEPLTVHATAGWSQAHLERDADQVRTLLQQAVAQWLGREVVWHEATAHRWRYASVAQADAPVDGQCWWDAALGLGACGDAWGGGGVEGAWMAARALAAEVQGALAAERQAAP